MEPFIGEIKLFAGTFAPRGWALCDGQLMAVAQNTPLFSLVGTIYGGDGETTFALPDLRGRVPIHQGTGSGLSPRAIGSKGGLENVSVSTTQLAAHSHGVSASNAPGTESDPTGNVLAASPSVSVYLEEAGTAALAGGSLGASSGGSSAHTNVQPFLCVNYIIALVGIYPSPS